MSTQEIFDQLAEIDNEYNIWCEVYDAATAENNSRWIKKAGKQLLKLEEIWWNLNDILEVYAA